MWKEDATAHREPLERERDRPGDDVEIGPALGQAARALERRATAVPVHQVHRLASAVGGRGHGQAATGTLLEGGVLAGLDGRVMAQAARRLIDAVGRFPGQSSDLRGARYRHRPGPPRRPGHPRPPSPLWGPEPPCPPASAASGSSPLEQAHEASLSPPCARALTASPRAVLTLSNGPDGRVAELTAQLSLGRIFSAERPLRARRCRSLREPARTASGSTIRRSRSTCCRSGSIIRPPTIPPTGSSTTCRLSSKGRGAAA
jgi:hypothetical protein